MLQTISHIIKGINQLNEWIGKGVSWLTAVLVVLVCFDVIIRYVFSDTQAWIMELEWHLFALVFLLGAGYAFKNDRHVRVDLFYANFSPKDKAWVNFIGALLFLLPWTIVAIYFSYEYANISFLIGERSPDPGGLPARYIIKYAVTVGFVLLFLQGLSSLLESLQVILTPNKRER